MDRFVEYKAIVTTNQVGEITNFEFFSEKDYEKLHNRIRELKSNRLFGNKEIITCMAEQDEIYDNIGPHNKQNSLLDNMSFRFEIIYFNKK